MTAKYGWIIDVDHITDEFEKIKDGEKVMGPSGIHPEYAAALKAHPEAGVKFKMYDDDDNLYYEGRIIGAFDGLEPLDDYGMPDSGCTKLDLFMNGPDSPIRLP